MSDPINHHWIPQFLLKKWEIAHAKIPTLGLVGPKYELSLKYYSAKSICSEEYLYSMASETEVDKQRIEKEYLQKIHNDASIIVDKIEADKTLTEIEKKEFSRFIFNLHLRNPITLVRMEKYSEEQKIIPEILDQAYLNGFIKRPIILTDERRKLIAYNATRLSITQDENHAIVTNLIRQFRWHFIRTSQTEYPIPLVISDQPTVVFNGLINNDSEIFLPLGPNILFWATRNFKFDPRTVDGRKFSMTANRQQTFSAHERLFGTANERFLENNFARRLRLSKMQATLR